MKTSKKKSTGGFVNLKEKLQILAFSSNTLTLDSKFWLSDYESDDKEWTQVTTKNKKKKKADVGGEEKLGRPS